MGGTGRGGGKGAKIKIWVANILACKGVKDPRSYSSDRSAVAVNSDRYCLFVGKKIPFPACDGNTRDDDSTPPDDVSRTKISSLVEHVTGTKLMLSQTPVMTHYERNTTCDTPRNRAALDDDS